MTRQVTAVSVPDFRPSFHTLASVKIRASSPDYVPGGPAERNARDYAGLTDRELVRRAQQGDRRAFDELTRHYALRTHVTAFMVLRDHHDAQDAVQDAFLAAWTGLALFRGDAEFPTWLHRIVTRRAITMASRRRVTARLDDLSYPGGTDPAEAVEQAAAMRSLADAVRELPAAQRSAIILRLDGLSYAQIADLSSTTIPAIRSHMFRARRALAATLSDWR